VRNRYLRRSSTVLSIENYETARPTMPHRHALRAVEGTKVSN